MKQFFMAIALCAALSAGVFTGCAGASTTAQSASASSASGAATTSMVAPNSSATANASMNTQTTAGTANASETINVDGLFTDRDLSQTADTSNAKQIELKSGEDVTITEEGTYVVSGTAEDATITVNADSSAKVQLVLNGASITNSDSAAIYVASADKVFVTTAEGTTNTLSTTGTFAESADSNIDGVIFASDDIVLNGMGTLVINSSNNGIVGKDDVKITGGTYNITAANHGIQGKDSVAISDGTFTIKAQKDGIHAENSDDTTLGYAYIAGGTFDIQASSDGIAGLSIVRIDGGNIKLNSGEGIEGTHVEINDGTVDVTASDDGINATSKSTAYSVLLQINGGTVNVNMGAGDTDALDSNGDLIINGGAVSITAQFPFDFDGKGERNGGTVTVNGEQITELTNSMMGGGGMGGRGNMGDMGGRGGKGGMNGQPPQGQAPQGQQGQAPQGQAPQGQQQQATLA